jgi:hypothetical protein
MFVVELLHYIHGNYWITVIQLNKKHMVLLNIPLGLVQKPMKLGAPVK